jgi:hypothetical protein
MAAPRDQHQVVEPLYRVDQQQGEHRAAYGLPQAK